MAQNQTQFNIQQAFNEKQWEAQQAQWKQEYEYTKMSDSQKIAYNYIVAAAAQGGDVSDALLQQAGISREDYNAMKQQAATYSGGGTTKKAADDTGTPAPTDATLDEMVKKALASNAVNTAKGTVAGGVQAPITTGNVASGGNNTSATIPIAGTGKTVTNPISSKNSTPSTAKPTTTTKNNKKNVLNN
jgi:hypothetical protein